MIQRDDLLTTGPAAAVLGNSPWTMIAWRRQRRGPVYFRVGRKVFYRLSDLEAFIASGRVMPDQDQAFNKVSSAYTRSPTNR